MKQITQNLRWLVTLLAVIVNVGAWAQNYQKISSVSDLTEEGTYILGCNGRLASSYYNKKFETISNGFTINGNLITITTGQPLIFKIKSTEGGYFIIFDSSYLGYSGNSTDFTISNETPTENEFIWTAETLEDGTIYFKNKGTTTRFIGKNDDKIGAYSTSNSFSTYPPATLYVESIPEIMADDIALDDDATSGIINYSINNPKDNGTLTALVTQGSDWITIVGSTNGKINLTTLINETTADRVGEITLTYSYGTKFVNKVVTVIQSGKKVKHNVTWSVDGVTSSISIAEGKEITFEESTDNIPNGYEFMGWSESTLEPTNTAPTFITSATMGTNDVTYYAVFAKLSGTNNEEQLIQTLKYDSWTIGNKNKTTDKNNYRLFGEGAYIESTAFDLSKLSKVIVYGGTYGGDEYNSLTIGDGTNTWKDVTVSGNKQTGVNTYIDGISLSETGKLRITSNSGNGTRSGVRISKVEIFTKEPVYCNYRTSLTFETVSISDVGWATYVTNNALDFGGKEVTAYIIETACIFTDRHQIALTEKTEVPAGTAILISKQEGSDNSFEIPTISNFVSEKVNALKASDGSVEGNGKIYVLNQVNGVVGFYPLNNGKKLSAGKAYLDMTNYLSESSDDVKYFFSFGNETVDAINKMDAEEGLGVLYNLNGQRVAAPLKGGIYIMNGKKVFVSTKK